MISLLNNSGIVVNIWFIVSLDTGLACGWMIKPYCLTDDDAEKFEMLKLLAETDFYTAKRYRVPKNYKVAHSAESLEGLFHVSAIKNELETKIDFYITTLEKDMPEMILFPYDDDKRRFLN